MKPIYIEVRAEVRYWEDALVNGVEDVNGTLIPFRELDLWTPVIRLVDGLVINWPDGMIADIHYKVCDQGEYWLQNVGGRRLSKWRGDYVPDKFLCHDDEGYGDYIIFKVGGDGFIINYRAPEIDESRWDDVS